MDAKFICSPDETHQVFYVNDELKRGVHVDCADEGKGKKGGI